LLWIVVLRRVVRRQSKILNNQVRLDTNIEERFRDLVENATDLVFTMDVHGMFSAANHATEATFGIFADDLQKMNVRQLIVPADLQAFDDIRALLIGGERSILRQIRIVAAGERQCVLEMNCRIRYLNGQPSFIEVIARDISHHNLEQHALERARASAEAASRAESEFLANMGHEI
jgi:PAS domain S-box-containing protein